MKIAFINGYAGENSTKADQLNQLFKQHNIKAEAVLTRVKFGNNIDAREADKLFKDNKFDLIIGTSFGGYISKYYASKYKLPLIMLNPVTDLDFITKKLGYFPKMEQRFKNLNSDQIINSIPEIHMFLNKDDDLIPNNIALKVFKKYIPNKIKVHINATGTHRFRNMPVLLPIIKKFLKTIKTIKHLEESDNYRKLERALLKGVVISRVRDTKNKDKSKTLKKLINGLATSDNIGTPKKDKPSRTIKFDRQTKSNILDTAKKIIKEKTKKEPETQKQKYKKLDILV